VAKIAFRGLCSGTEKRHSAKKGTDYTITKFVELPSLSTFEVFGDLGLPAHEDSREYVLDANVVSLGNVKVITGSVSVGAPKKS